MKWVLLGVFIVVSQILMNKFQFVGSEYVNLEPDNGEVIGALIGLVVGVMLCFGDKSPLTPFFSRHKALAWIVVILCPAAGSFLWYFISSFGHPG